MIDKVNFFICGTQKGGTSALDCYLRLHPEICMANQKEVHFFDNDSNFQNDNINYNLLHHQFSPKRSSKIFGEATPIYMYWKSAPRRLWEYNSNALLIILLRDPSERAFSHWQMEFNRKNEHNRFLNSIFLELIRKSISNHSQHRVFSYIDRGFYIDQLYRIWDYFPKKQTLIIKSEHLKSQPYFTLKQVFNFLNVEQIPITRHIYQNRNNYIYNLRGLDKIILKMIYKSDIRRLEKELSWDCSNWQI